MSSARPPESRPAPPSAAAGAIFQVLLGLSLVIAGGCFVWLMGRSFLRAKEMRSWPEVPCEILVSEIEERKHDSQSPPEFRFNVSFGYEWDGAPRTGDHLTLRGSPWTSNQGLAAQRAAEYPVGKSTTCLVDPKRPDLAVLKPDSMAPGYSIWFPGLFLIAGIGITVRAFRTNRGGASRPAY